MASLYDGRRRGSFFKVYKKEIISLLASNLPSFWLAVKPYPPYFAASLSSAEGMAVDMAYLGSFLGLLAFVQALLPRGRDLWHLIRHLKKLIDDFRSPPAMRFEVSEQSASNHSNLVYADVTLHLGSISATASEARTLRLCQGKGEGKLSCSIADGEEVVETFEGVRMSWKHHVEEASSHDGGGGGGGGRHRDDRTRYYRLNVERKWKDVVLESYMSHIRDHAKQIRHDNSQRMLYINFNHSYNSPWTGVPFSHPATFDTVALDPQLKQSILADLDGFMKAEKLYKRVGRAWKRGYLLYGPPGTGKSSMIAAIANYTGYDIYDLELTEVMSNTELRKLLLKTTNKSVIVIEDIDCSENLSVRDRGSKRGGDKDSKPEAPEFGALSRLTLSGLLNFTDGLYSCCGSERIVIFTTNHIDKLDGALLRSGRMDLHILMSYCTFPAFQVLARTHLEIDDHRLYPEIAELMEEAQMTPAQVADVLIKSSGDAQAALEELLRTLTSKKNTEDSDRH